jgi:broad specificity phosphatase PhoE
MAVTFHFVRHGATIANEAGIFMGMLDLPLSRAGLHQAVVLRDSLRGMRIDAVYCSPLLRAYHTALIALELADPRMDENVGLLLAPRVERERQCHAELIVDPRLAERSFGDLQGEPKQGYDQRHTKYRGRDVTRSFEDRADGGESFADLEARMREFISDVARRHAAAEVLVFSHNGPIRVARKLLLGLTEAETLAHSSPHCGLITLRA